MLRKWVSYTIIGLFIPMFLFGCGASDTATPASADNTGTIQLKIVANSATKPKISV